MTEQAKDWKNQIPTPTDQEHKTFLDNLDKISENESIPSLTEIVHDIKSHRIQLDEAISIMKNMPPSREISISITSAQNGRMWLGKTLQSLDQPNPYPDSKNPINVNIEPTADSCESVKLLSDVGHIQKVKIMRKRITDIYDEIENLSNQECFNSYNKLGFVSIHKSWGYIVEANLWLGMELGRINNENTKK